MFVANHTVNWVDGIPVMEFDFIGSTGNLYKVTIGKEPSCDCPDACKGNQCKHICYGMHLIDSSTTVIVIII